MRLIDADRLREELNSIYDMAAELDDAEFMKIMASCVGLLDRSPTMSAAHTAYEKLSEKNKKIVDSVIGALNHGNE